MSDLGSLIARTVGLAAEEVAQAAKQARAPQHVTAAPPPQLSARATEELASLNRRLDRLTLICHALWTLLQDKTGLREEDLAARVKMIDMLDGKQDGRRRPTVAQCPRCQRAIAARAQKCVFCGTARPTATIFDTAM